MSPGLTYWSRFFFPRRNFLLTYLGQVLLSQQEPYLDRFNLKS